MQVEGLQGKDVKHCKLFSFGLVIYALVLRLLSLWFGERGPGAGLWVFLVYVVDFGV